MPTPLVPGAAHGAQHQQRRLQPSAAPPAAPASADQQRAPPAAPAFTVRGERRQQSADAGGQPRHPPLSSAARCAAGASRRPPPPRALSTLPARLASHGGRPAPGEAGACSPPPCVVPCPRPDRDPVTHAPLGMYYVLTAVAETTAGPAAPSRCYGSGTSQVRHRYVTGTSRPPRLAPARGGQYASKAEGSSSAPKDHEGRAGGAQEATLDSSLFNKQT